MRVHLTYIHHNCFVLAAADRTLLFDPPADKFLTHGEQDLIRNLVRGRDLTVFVSHGHEDHLTEDLAGLMAPADSACCVLSDDIEDLRPEAVPDGFPVLTVEPDEAYDWRGMHIETAMANDLGVAFFITLNGLRVYFGGDLAEWIWPGAPEAEAAFTRSYFAEAVDRVRDFAPQVLFSNVDHRLPNLAGGAAMLEGLLPPLFVPMHGFGDTGYLTDFARRHAVTGTTIFTYAMPGDDLEMDLDATPAPGTP